MASLLKDKFTSARKSLDGSNASEESDTEIANKYMLRVSAGPSYDASTHKPVYVNSDTPCILDNDLMTAKIKVRIRDYHGLPKGSQDHSTYFDDPSHKKDQYSIAFSFVPKKDIPSKDLVWGNDFDQPVRDRLPPGFNTAFKIVKEFIDPGLSCDAYADQPWLYGPALSCWFAFRIGEKAEGDDFPAPTEEHAMIEGGDGTGESIRKELKLPDASEKRRKHFLDASNRESLVFEKGRCYQGDFFNPYIDFSKFALKLPGFSLGVIRYINDKTHHLRYTFKNRETGEVCFCVVLTLLFGEELQRAIDADQPPQADKEATRVDGASDEVDPVRSGNDEPASVSGAEDDRLEQVHDTGDSAIGDETAADIQLRQSRTNPREHLGQTAMNTPAASSAEKADDGVGEISKMLQDTSTVDGTGKKGGFLT